MASGGLRFPRSEIVVPFTLLPGFSSETGIFTSGVQVYAARIYDWPSSVYGTKVRTGALVSKRPCEPCQISILAPLLAAWNGNGIERRLDENSSFESPATITLPSMYAISVIVSSRGLLRPSFDAG